MARPKNTIPSKEYKICMPLDLASKMELELYSELEDRIPHGCLSGYINDLVRADQKKKAKKLKEASNGNEG